MLMGIQGSGKSTYARVMNKDKGYPIVSSDLIRTEMNIWDETDVFPFVYKRCAEYIENNIDFIYDATNITPKVRQRFWDNMKEYGLTKFEVEAHYFTSDVALSRERIERRNQDPNERYFPIEVLQNYADNFVPPTLDEGFTKIVVIDHYFHDWDYLY